MSAYNGKCVKVPLYPSDFIPTRYMGCPSGNNGTVALADAKWRGVPVSVRASLASDEAAAHLRPRSSSSNSSRSPRTHRCWAIAAAARSYLCDKEAAPAGQLQAKNDCRSRAVAPGARTGRERVDKYGATSTSWRKYPFFIFFISLVELNLNPDVSKREAGIYIILIIILKPPASVWCAFVSDDFALPRPVSKKSQNHQIITPFHTLSKRRIKTTY